MDQSLEKFHRAGEAIERYIRPATLPLAVKLVREEREIPPESRRPHRVFGVQNFVCQNFKIARTYGWTMAVTQADTNCYLARNIYGWDPVTEETIAAAHQFNLGLYARDMETSARLEPHLYRLSEPGIALQLGDRRQPPNLYRHAPGPRQTGDDIAIAAIVPRPTHHANAPRLRPKPP